jgi:FeS assembly SUF system protein|tara:strand:+ start:477 stop:866 length:390 start_codon:yes stop_codon:yes gene_type:complete
MTEEKKINDFISHENTSFCKNFKKIKISQQIYEDQIIERIKTVMDPEIPVNLYDLGLIYNINVDEKNNIVVEMTLTNPNCPVAGSMPENVGRAISSLLDISSIKVSLVWYPKWSKKMMSEEAKLALDVF